MLVSSFHHWNRVSSAELDKGDASPAWKRSKNEAAISSVIQPVMLQDSWVYLKTMVLMVPPKPKSLSLFHSFPYLRWSLVCSWVPSASGTSKRQATLVFVFALDSACSHSQSPIIIISTLSTGKGDADRHLKQAPKKIGQFCFLPISSHFQTVSIDYGYPLYTPFPLIPYCVYCMHGTWFYHPLPLVLHPYHCIASCCYCLSAFNSP